MCLVGIDNDASLRFAREALRRDPAEPNMWHGRPARVPSARPRASRPSHIIQIARRGSRRSPGATDPKGTAAVANVARRPALPVAAQPATTKTRHADHTDLLIIEARRMGSTFV